MSHFPYKPTKNPPLRVLHVIKGLGPGGAERLILNQLATTTGDIDYSVAFAVPEKDHLVEAITQHGAVVTLLDQSKLPFSLHQSLRFHRPDIVHAHSPVLAVAARLIRASPLGTFSMVTTEHNRWPRHHRLTRTANRLTAPLDDARIAVSFDVRQSMSRPVAATTQVIDHGIPIEEVSKARHARAQHRHNIAGPNPDDQVIIGIVANFRPEKDYDTFLRAASQALVQCSHLHLVVVGQGPGEQAFRAQGASLDRLHVLGYRPDAHEVMAAFDVFTLSSRHEGKPVSLMEAFALGLPAVATRAGGIPEVITHDYNGLLVNVGDHDALARAWVQIATDQALRSRLAAGAAETGPDFDAARSTALIEKSYRSLRLPSNDR